MAIEISVFSVGAVVLVVALLIVLNCISHWRNKSVQADHKSKSTGKYGLTVFMYCIVYCMFMDYAGRISV